MPEPDGPGSALAWAGISPSGLGPHGRAVPCGTLPADETEMRPEPAEAESTVSGSACRRVRRLGTRWAFRRTLCFAPCRWNRGTGARGNYRSQDVPGSRAARAESSVVFQPERMLEGGPHDCVEHFPSSPEPCARVSWQPPPPRARCGTRNGFTPESYSRRDRNSGR